MAGCSCHSISRLRDNPISLIVDTVSQQTAELINFTATIRRKERERGFEKCRNTAGITVLFFDTFELVKKLSSARIKERTCPPSSTEMIECAREDTLTSHWAWHTRQNIGRLRMSL